jgi:hypothetical protein
MAVACDVLMPLLLAFHCCCKWRLIIVAGGVSSLPQVVNAVVLMPK